MAHPVRFAILTALNDGVASPIQLARRMDEPIGTVAYHTRILLDLGAIELVETAQRRGATEHFYRATMRPFFSDEDTQLLSPELRRELIKPVVRAIFDDAAAALGTGGFDAEQVHISRTPLELDDQGVQEVAELLMETVQRVIDLQAECTNRRAAAGADAAPSVHSELAIMHFDRAPAAKRDRRSR